MATRRNQNMIADSTAMELEIQAMKIQYLEKRVENLEQLVYSYSHLPKDKGEKTNEELLNIISDLVKNKSQNQNENHNENENKTTEDRHTLDFRRLSTIS